MGPAMISVTFHGRTEIVGMVIDNYASGGGAMVTME